MAKKRKQKQPTKRREVELSDFEKNVIRKNIEERKKMEQELGIHTLHNKLRGAIGKKKFFFLIGWRLLIFGRILMKFFVLV